METVQLTYPHHLIDEHIEPSVVAIGFFDGVHEGHKAVIQQAVRQAKEKNELCSVITFFPHPSVVLKKGKVTAQYITTIEEKEALMEQLGVDVLYIVNFNEQLSQLSPAAFIDHFIVGLHITHVVAGFDYTFGHKGAGNMKNITQYLPSSIGVTVIDKVDYESVKVSSTEIREALKIGDVARVQTLLGRSYSTTGIVVDGDKRGRQIGFPTANLSINDDKLLPKQGVYGVTIKVKDNEYYGLLNLGVKPTFHDNLPKPTAEVYILDFDDNIYGETVEVHWLTFIRSEKKFNGVDEIITQLTTDEENIRKYFEI